MKKASWIALCRKDFVIHCGKEFFCGDLTYPSKLLPNPRSKGQLDIPAINSDVLSVWVPISRLRCIVFIVCSRRAGNPLA